MKLIRCKKSFWISSGDFEQLVFFGQLFLVEMKYLPLPESHSYRTEEQYLEDYNKYYEIIELTIK
jgi:hypothetical protein